jgi:hypothetical protein
MIPTINESYDGLTASATCVNSFCKLSYVPFPISQSIKSSWIYSYQCGFSILTNYVPAVLAKYTIAGVLLPILKLILLSLPTSSWMRSVWLVKMLLPYTLNAMPEDDLLDNANRRQFRTYRYLSNSMIDVLMLFTYGIFCHFLTFLIVASIVFNELVNHLQVGSYLFDRSQLQLS